MTAVVPPSGTPETWEKKTEPAGDSKQESSAAPLSSEVHLETPSSSTDVRASSQSAGNVPFSDRAPAPDSPSPLDSVNALGSPSSYLSRSSSPPPPAPPPGLANLGNTCYLNSVLQVLYRSRALRASVLAYRPPAVSSFASDLACELRAVFRALENAVDLAHASPASYARDGIDYVSPRALICLLRDSERCDFDAEGQQDAQEFLRFLLDKLHDALVSPSASDSVSSVDSSDTDPAPPGMPSPPTLSNEHPCDPKLDKSTSVRLTVSPPPSPPPRARHPRDDSATANVDLPPSKKPRHARPHASVEDAWDPNRQAEPHSRSPSRTRRETTERTSAPAAMSQIVQTVFQGRVETVTRCLQCEHANSRAETFLDLSLPAEIGRSLTWALSTHGKDEHMDGSNKYACSVCNTYQEARRCWRLSRIPPLFTIHLKLFAYALNRPLGSKVPAAMPCPFTLRLTRWCTDDCPQRNTLYRLQSIIVHDGGSSSSGHYYAYVNVEDSGWYLFDDADVSPTSEECIRRELFTGVTCRNTAYLLFYERDDGGMCVGEP